MKVGDRVRLAKLPAKSGPELQDHLIKLSEGGVMRVQDNAVLVRFDTDNMPYWLGLEYWEKVKL